MSFVPRGRMRDWWGNLTREQQLSVGLLSVCGMLALGLSVQSLRVRIRSPFTASRTVLALQDQSLFQTDDDQATKQRSTDTDRDGLNDFLEINTYRTSAYLPDTDSDGIPDGIEIAQRTDPLCPQGKPCAQPLNVDGVALSSTSSQRLQELVQTREVPLVDSMMGGADPSTQGAAQFLQAPPDPATMTAVEVREYLVKNNLVRADQLEGVSDTDVLSIYRSSYDEVVKSKSVPSGVQTSAGPTP